MEFAVLVKHRHVQVYKVLLDLSPGKAVSGVSSIPFYVLYGVAFKSGLREGFIPARS